MNTKLPSINRRQLREKQKIKEDRIKEKLRKYNGQWNDQKFQLYW